MPELSAPPGGFLVVLTADRILTARYPLLLDGMAAASLTTTTPRLLFDPLMVPQPRAHGPRATLAPLGLRRVEAALLEGGFTSAEVAIVDEDHLAGAIGQATRVIGISTGDPFGHGMNSTTMAAIMGGTPWATRGFQRVLAQVRRLIARRAPQARVVVGGSGAWQATNGGRAGIDGVITGYCEGDVAARFRAWCDGMPLTVVAGRPPEVGAIPALRGATTMGAVEISRGCGLGCTYCTIAGTPMRHLAAEAILADVQLNLAAGRRHVALLSEDCMRYGGQGLSVQPAALLDLVERLRRLPGVGLIQVDHANLATTARFSDDELAALSRLLRGGLTDRAWINVGVESANGSLLAANGGMAKLGGCPPAEWGGFCAQQVHRLVAAGFFPFVSLLMALPGETSADVAATHGWAEALFEDPALGVFPLVYAPVDGGAAPPLTRAHWRLLRDCWQRNFPRMARLYAEQQRAAGVGRGSRTLIQLLGRGQEAQWRGLFAWRLWRAKS